MPLKSLRPLGTDNRGQYRIVVDCEPIERYNRFSSISDRVLLCNQISGTKFSSHSSIESGDVATKSRVANIKLQIARLRMQQREEILEVETTLSRMKTLNALILAETKARIEHEVERYVTPNHSRSRNRHIVQPQGPSTTVSILSPRPPLMPKSNCKYIRRRSGVSVKSTSSARKRLDTWTKPDIVCDRDENLNLTKRKPELAKFYGDPRRFKAFVENLKKSIVDLSIDDDIRLKYLLQSCSGEALELIQHCSTLSNGYRKALLMLEDKYGTVREFHKHLVDEARIESCDAKESVGFARLMKNRQLFCGDYREYSVLGKFESTLEIVDKDCDARHAYPTKFVRDQSEIAEPVRDKVLDRKTTEAKFEMTSFAATLVKKPDRDVFLPSQGSHQIEDCDKFVGCSDWDSSFAFKQKNLCLKCRGGTHLAENCPERNFRLVDSCKKASSHLSLINRNVDDQLDGASIASSDAGTNRKLDQKGHLDIVAVDVYDGARELGSCALQDGASRSTPRALQSPEELKPRGDPIGLNLDTTAIEPNSLELTRSQFSHTSLMSPGKVIGSGSVVADSLPAALNGLPRGKLHKLDLKGVVRKFVDGEDTSLIGARPPEASIAANEQSGLNTVEDPLLDRSLICLSSLDRSLSCSSLLDRSLICSSSLDRSLICSSLSSSVADSVNLSRVSNATLPLENPPADLPTTADQVNNAGPEGDSECVGIFPLGATFSGPEISEDFAAEAATDRRRVEDYLICATDAEGDVHKIKLRSFVREIDKRRSHEFENCKSSNWNSVTPLVDVVNCSSLSEKNCRIIYCPPLSPYWVRPPKHLLELALLSRCRHSLIVV